VVNAAVMLRECAGLRQSLQACAPGLGAGILGRWERGTVEGEGMPVDGAVFTRSAEAPYVWNTF
jgi:hypothetical protein